MSSRRRRILHLDMDAFYASVEALDDPRLAGKAVVVGGKGPRSVVAVCSYEARKYGVHSAMPMRRALDLCPRAIVLRPRMERYRDISRAIFEYLGGQAPLVEKMSVDEGYLDISEMAGSDEGALEIGRLLKAEIREQFGLVCSVGVAPCKFAAKIASDLEKPNALVLVRAEDLLDFLAPLDVGKIPGVGQVGRGKLNEMGVETIADLRLQQREALVGRFGKWGERLYDFARGIDPRPVVTEHERKSMGSEHTFDEDVMDRGKLEETVREQAGKIAELLAGQGLRARTVTVKVRYSNFEMITRQQSFSTSLRDVASIGRVACEMLDRTEAGRRPVRLVGVSVSSFAEAEEPDELPLFLEET